MAEEKSKIYQNPVDKKTYVSPEGWKTYEPEQGVPSTENRKVTVGGVRLLNAQEDFEARTSVAELAAYLKEVERIAISVLSSSAHKAIVLVQFKSVPNKTEIQIAHQGELGNDLLQKFYDQTSAAKPLKVSKGELSYQVEYHVEP